MFDAPRRVRTVITPNMTSEEREAALKAIKEEQGLLQTPRIDSNVVSRYTYQNPSPTHGYQNQSPTHGYQNPSPTHGYQNPSPTHGNPTQVETPRTHNARGIITANMTSVEREEALRQQRLERQMSVASQQKQSVSVDVNAYSPIRMSSLSPQNQVNQSYQQQQVIPQNIPQNIPQSLPIQQKPIIPPIQEFQIPQQYRQQSLNQVQYPSSVPTSVLPASTDVSNQSNNEMLVMLSDRISKIEEYLKQISNGAFQPCQG